MSAAYRVVKGDTLSAIARHHNVPLDLLLANNPAVADANTIQVGMTLLIPDTTPERAVSAHAIRITPTQQSADRPADAPLVDKPVLVTMALPTYYVTERGPILSTRPIFCARAFASTVLEAMHGTLETAGWSVAHVGVYNPRPARRASGALIQPVRWSNHAHGEAMDFKGIVHHAAGRDRPMLVGISEMKQRHPALLENLLAECEAAIKASGRRPEIVDEDGWYHIGLWPAK